LANLCRGKKKPHDENYAHGPLLIQLCNRSLPRLLAMVGDHELHSKEYYGDVFRGIQKKTKN